MDIKDYRSSFGVFVIESDQERQWDMVELLESENYQPRGFSFFASAVEELEISPPHVILYTVSSDPTPDTIKIDHRQIDILKDRLPESHIILICPEGNLDYGLAFYDKGVYDVIGLPLAGTDQVTRSCDRAILSDYYKYLNEQLLEERGGADRLNEGSSSLKSNATGVAFLSQWLNKLNSLVALSDIVSHISFEVLRHSGGKGVVYFKYVETQTSLVAAHYHGDELATVRGIGLNLIESAGEHFREQLFLPASLKGLKELVEDVYSTRKFCAVPCVANNQVKGVFVVLGVGQDFAGDDYLKLVLDASEKRLSLLALEQRLDREQKIDPRTSLVKRSVFLQEITNEISRARRIELPVSLAVFNLNVTMKNHEVLSEDDRSILLKVAGSIVTKNCRVYDRIGELSPRQFAVVFPHAAKSGAAIKAERLRRILETVNFSELVPTVVGVTFSVGVSEYPSLCQDADDILLTADSALEHVMAGGQNKVCLASVSENFVPDFIVNHPGERKQI